MEAGYTQAAGCRRRKGGTENQMKQEKRRILALLLAAMLCVGMLTGCSALDTSLPSTEEQRTTKTRKKTRTASPQKAIEQIYQELGKRIGLVEPTAEQLETVVGLDPEDVKEAYVRYVEGDFGADDVYIILPKEGKNEYGESYREHVLAQLKERKDSRTREFANYDVYNSTEIAENAVIFERGGYVVMLMLEDNESARRIVERYIPEKLNLS